MPCATNTVAHTGGGHGTQSRQRYIAKVAAGAAVSLTGLVVAAPLLKSNSPVVPPVLAAEETVQKDASSYVKFDVQLSDAEEGSFVVEVRPGVHEHHR